MYMTSDHRSTLATVHCTISTNPPKTDQQFSTIFATLKNNVDIAFFAKSIGHSPSEIKGWAEETNLPNRFQWRRILDCVQTYIAIELS